MRILILSSFLPYPLHSGGHVRLYNLMKQLSAHHKLTLVCEKRPHQTDKDIAEVKKLCEEVICVDRQKQWSLKNITKTSVSPMPFLLVGHTLPLLREKIIEVLKEKTFDVIHVETFYVMQNLPKTYLPVVLAEHNVEYQVYRKYVSTAPLPLRPALLADIAKIRYWEKKFWKQATKLVAVSEVDKSYMGRTDTVVVPNGVDIKSFPFVSAAKKIDRKEKRILFMGDFTWIQNVNAALFILNEIWPEIESRMKNQEVSKSLKLWIVGKHIPASIKERHGGSVIVDENAPDETAKIYQKSFALLAPIRVGGGTSYKILESMASGVPVVTTELGVKGLGAKPGKHALVSESAATMAEDLVSLLDDEEKYALLQKEARAFIERHYTWDEITKTLEKVYKEALQE